MRFRFHPTSQLGLQYRSLTGMTDNRHPLDLVEFTTSSVTKTQTSAAVGSGRRRGERGERCVPRRPFSWGRVQLEMPAHLLVVLVAGCRHALTDLPAPATAGRTRSRARVVCLRPLRWSLQLAVWWIHRHLWLPTARRRQALPTGLRSRAAPQPPLCRPRWRESGDARQKREGMIERTKCRRWMGQQKRRKSNG